jgi:hypothetical protein
MAPVSMVRAAGCTPVGVTCSATDTEFNENISNTTGAYIWVCANIFVYPWEGLTSGVLASDGQVYCCFYPAWAPFCNGKCVTTIDPSL